MDMNSGTFESPRLESYSSSDSSTSGLSNNGQEHGDTQRSLQQASMALEVAYNRIRQVRRSLRELSDSLPSTDSLLRFSTNFNEFEPGHDALLLAGGSFEADNESSTGFDASTNLILSQIPPTVNLSDVEPSMSTGDAEGANEANTIDPTDPIFLQSFFTPNVLPSRFSRQELANDMQYLQRRGLVYDPGTTLRGLRVAARETQGRELRQLNAESADHDHLLWETAINAVHSNTGGSYRAERHHHLGRGFESPDGRRVANSPPLAAAPPSWRTPDRRWRIRPELRVSHRPLNDVAPDRFHTILNTPHSNIPRNVPRLPLSTDSRLMTSPSAIEQHRRHQEEMQLDAMASDAHIDWSDEQFISRLFLGQEDDSAGPREPQPIDSQSNPETIRITRTTDTAVSPPEHSPPRRGWARLDADGNEISSDEEEELERSRTAYRIQALQRSRQNLPGDNADNPLLGGMHQNYSGQRNVYGSVLDSTMRIQDENRETHDFLGSDLSPLYIDPLPMPLASMTSAVDKLKNEDIHPDILVPKHAYLAGR